MLALLHLARWIGWQLVDPGTGPAPEPRLSCAQITIFSGGRAS